MKVNKKLLALLTISLGMGIAGCSKSEQKIENKTTSENVSVNNKDQTEKVDTNDNENLGIYTIESISDVSIANAKREILNIVVKDNQSLDQLYKISQKEALNYTKDHPVNALTIGFYTDKEHIGEGYDMGSVLYAPNGELKDAMNVTAGDYSSFKFVNNLEEPLELPKGKSLEETKGSTDVEQVKNDILKVEDTSKVNVSRDGSKLIMHIKEMEDHPYVDAEENTIATYTDWCLDNINSDISEIDITVERPNSSVHARLDTNKIETDNGRYFDTNYIRENIV